MKNITKTILLITLSICLFAAVGCSIDEQNKEEANNKNESSATKEKAEPNLDGELELTDEKSIEKDKKLEEQKADVSEKDKSKEDKSKGKSSGIETIYTDLDESKCKTVDLNEEEEWSVQECPGIKGYKLEVLEGDLRQTINVIAPSGGKYELDFQKNVSLAFSSFGEKAEWRVKKDGEKISPIALITRYNVNEKPEKPEKVSSYLVVTKFDGEFVCITDVVKPIKNANKKARELADIAPTKPCLKGNAS